MFIVTGATGQLGHAIVEQLLQRAPVAQIGVSVRDPDKASALAARGVRVRRGDFEDEASLLHAFEGATQVLIVSSNARRLGGDSIGQHRRAIAAARQAGARRLLYTSHMAASATSAFSPMLDHAATEELLRDSGLPFTSLRNGFYADSGAQLLGGGVETGELAAPADGPVSWTAHADLAEAAAILLVQEGRYDGPTPPLVASQALDLAALAAIAAALTGRAIARSVVEDQAWRAQAIARGLPEGVADIALGLYVAARAGEFASADKALQQLLGRPPIAMREVLAARLAAPR